MFSLIYRLSAHSMTVLVGSLVVGGIALWSGVPIYWNDFNPLFIIAFIIVFPVSLVCDGLLFRESYAGWRYPGFQIVPVVSLLMLLLASGMIPTDDWMDSTSGNAALSGSVPRAVDPFDTRAIDREVLAKGAGLTERPVIEEPIVIVEEVDTGVSDLLRLVGLSSWDSNWPRQVALQILFLVALYKSWQIQRIRQKGLAGAGWLTDPWQIAKLRISDERKHVVTSLLERSQAHKTRASSVLFLILGMIGLGILLYFTAGNLISSDIRNSDFAETRGLIDRLSAEERELERAISTDTTSRRRLWNELARYTENFQTPIDPGIPSTFSNGECTLKFSTIREIDTSDTFTEACRTSAQIADRIDLDRALAQRIDLNRQRLESLRKAQTGVQEFLRDNLTRLIGLENPQNNLATEQLIASGVTRFGILFVIIYLVQILVGIYRYSMRQSEFYESRANALLLAGPDATQLGDWKEELLSADIDFGKAPAGPSEYAASVFDRYLRRGGKKDSET